MDLAFGGAGVAKLKGEDGKDFVVFVENTVPGDKVEAHIYRMKKQYAEGQLTKVITPSPKRVTPRCKHFGVCGGCSMQFLNYEDQLEWKEKMVADSLRQLGGFANVNLMPIIGCDSPWFYRNKMEYSFGEVENKCAIGFHLHKKFDRVFDMEECFLESEISPKIAIRVKEWAKENKIAPFNAFRSTGVLKNLIVREGKNTGEILVNLVTNSKEFKDSKIFSDWIMKEFPQITSLYHTTVTVRKGHRTAVDETHLAGKKTLIEKLKVGEYTLEFEILPQAFFQPNTIQAQILYGKILEFAQKANKSGIGFALDLFCGTGTIGMFLAKTANNVYGVEINEFAIENAEKNAKTNNITNIKFFSGDISEFFAKEYKNRADLIVTDPPRAGISSKSLSEILTFKTPTWIYVSCNPSTLARDLKIICENGYKIDKIQPIDMYPHTYHVETVCLLKR